MPPAPFERSCEPRARCVRDVVLDAVGHRASGQDHLLGPSGRHLNPCETQAQ
jgi:hypothetical protein